ncbi:hypothetical protein DP939_34980 [Spongiactinospora rosea]|uniref:Uncharacterized protein n=1 Tax=Spongiactinospora rosea TaxID=2248750 RepID=A0A366LQ89_9ACTN|nr:hypothetical protein [Spongiactinospora rosea]RBQ15579.1 hypothetical protein DP939_34980 [Spongiactinospora rosea]
MDAFAPEFVRRTWVELELEEMFGSPPQWIDRAGDLVTDGDVNWSTPELTKDGTFYHGVPPGRYPVYAGTDRYDLFGADGPTRYYVNTLFMPLVPPDRLADAQWDDEGYDNGPHFRDYACLWSVGAERATLPHSGDKSETILRIERSLLSEEALSRRGNWTDDLVDPVSGANVLSFPVWESTIRGFEARDADDEILALLFVAWYP